MTDPALHFVFTDFPGPGKECLFVEVETPDGKSINAGEWRKREDGLAELVVKFEDPAAEALEPRLDERALFEQWAEADNRRLEPQEFEERAPDNNHYYLVDSTNELYIGWCARAASVLPEPVAWRYKEPGDLWHLSHALNPRWTELGYEWEALYAEPPRPDRSEAGAVEEHRYATRLVISLMEKHYPDRSPEWSPLPDLMGVLTQIDNLTTGLSRTALAATDRSEAGMEGAVRAAKKAIALAVQFNDFGHADENGDWHVSGAQINAFDEVCQDAARAALLAAAPFLRVPEGWRPIASAPKDGTHVILCVPSLHDGFPDIIGEAYWDTDHPSDGGDWWWAGTDYSDYYADSLCNTNADPTHWHPLPSAPQPDQGDGL